VILGFLLAAIVSASYFTRHVVITTDMNQLMSSSLPWRQQERAIDLAFPQRVGRILVVIDAATPEAAVNAADALVNELSPRSDVIRTIGRANGGDVDWQPARMDFGETLARLIAEIHAQADPRKWRMVSMNLGTEIGFDK
jgi:hypothetical protein